MTAHGWFEVRAIPCPSMGQTFYRLGYIGSDDVFYGVRWFETAEEAFDAMHARNTGAMS